MKFAVSIEGFLFVEAPNGDNAVEIAKNLLSNCAPWIDVGFISKPNLMPDSVSIKYDRRARTVSG